MNTKYIDLAARIIRDRMTGPITGLGGETYALRWLDSHPDQVPGRTITESESKYLFDVARLGLMYWPNALDRTGITVVPDPEPTNAEKLAEILRSIHGQASPEYVAESLDELGVKAPGGDHD